MQEVKMSDLAVDLTKLILDGTKVQWHQDRLKKWAAGERFAPITVDMALTRACNYACHFCYAQMQENERKNVTWDVIKNLFDDFAEVGVKGVSLVSDGESSIHKHFIDAVVYGHSVGLSMAVGSNGYALDEEKIRKILPALTYFRFNFSAGEPKRYAEIMGVKEMHFHKTVENVKTMVRLKKELGLNVTIGLQMVLDPRYHDQVLPLAKLGKELRPDYLIIKHCSDDENGFLGVDYSKYKEMYETLHQAEALSDDEYKVSVKWSKIEANGKRSYQRCYGPPFLIQLSGSGLIAPCGMLFGERYKKFHMGSFVTERFKDVVFSDRYWEVVEYLSSPDFDAQKMCGSLCLQHKVNEYLDGVKKGEISMDGPMGESPPHLNFI